MASLLYETNTMDFFNSVLIFIPEVFILCKKEWRPRELVALNFDIPHSFNVLFSIGERSQHHVLKN